MAIFFHFLKFLTLEAKSFHFPKFLTTCTIKGWSTVVFGSFDLGWIEAVGWIQIMDRCFEAIKLNWRFLVGVNRLGPSPLHIVHRRAALAAFVLASSLRILFWASTKFNWEYSSPLIPLSQQISLTLFISALCSRLYEFLFHFRRRIVRFLRF